MTKKLKSFIYKEKEINFPFLIEAEIIEGRVDNSQVLKTLVDAYNEKAQELEHYNLVKKLIDEIWEKKKVYYIHHAYKSIWDFKIKEDDPCYFVLYNIKDNEIIVGYYEIELALNVDEYSKTWSFNKEELKR